MAAAEPCSCLDCSCCPQPPAVTRERSVKRKLDASESNGIDLDGYRDRNEDEDEDQDPDRALEALLARVGAEDECGALREALASQQQTIQELYLELEEERDASSSAANETMSMILRLQREKAELQLEARQFRSYAEEKMAHDQEELAALEEALARREEAVEALSQEIEALRNRLAVCGVDPDAVLRDLEQYPPLKCEGDERGDESPRDGSGEVEDDALSDGGSEKVTHVEEKEVVAGNSPPPRAEVQREEEFPDDRIYTVDAVHAPASAERGDSPRGSVVRSAGVEEEEIKKLYVRLQALEADRESMKETIVSMRADTAQLELLKVIALNLSKGVAAQQSIEKQDQRASRKVSLADGFFWTSLFKWIRSFGLWKKTRPCRYSFGLSSNNPGLLLLVTRPQSSYLGHRCVTRWGGPLYRQHQP